MAGALGASYSLWLEPPPGTLRERLRKEVAAQAAARDGPLFEPHVTLLGDVAMAEAQLLETAAALAKRIQPFRVNLDDVACGPSFHQCVYILASKEPPLLAANADARAAFGKPEPPAPYMPHLSLLYSDASDPDRRDAAAAAVARLWGEAAGYDTLLPDAGFTAASLSLWLTPAEDRSLASWRRVAEFPLGGGGGE
ncbi:MAG: RNA ligase/cyclic nucleotide phosphodiesterase [Monoraphidium minutum]|nr:MAG: RNA ligase/cyclic nucleotide phosphodiesterase [Monoraphidium minutum]